MPVANPTTVAPAAPTVQLFATRPVPLPADSVSEMLALIRTIEQVVRSPRFPIDRADRNPADRNPADRNPADENPEDRAPSADADPGGVLLGYDFHLTPAGPRLIEINTNAGGILLAAIACREVANCCPEILGRLAGPDVADLEERLLAAFLGEWRRARGDAPLRRVAIVDDAPQTQFLFREFEAFAALFRHAGIDAVIRDPAELLLTDEGLADRGGTIDLVYNRLTDFRLALPDHAHLRSAWLAGAVVLPNPAEYARYADKRNLVRLSDPYTLAKWGLDPAIQQRLLRGIPRTRQVQLTDAATLWTERNNLFFKPSASFGSRGAYRGSKVTRRVFELILANDYIAQDLVPPSECQGPDEAAAPFKFDVRIYTWRATPLLIAARVYQGQTTNFRTPGGGFAPVCLA